MRSVKQVKQPIDPRLVCVATRYKELTRELSDAEWDEDPSVELVRAEFKHYQALLQQGLMPEPKF